MTVKQYFDKQSATYDSRRHKGFLGSLVSRERGAVLRSLAPHKGEHILDAGCGAGYYSLLLRSFGSIPYGIDLSSRMIRQLRRHGIAGRVAPLETFTLQRRFDKILCAGALEFTRDASAVLRSFSDHIHKKGLLVLLYPRPSPAGYLYKFYHLTHGFSIHLFSSKEIERLVTRAGFRVRSHFLVDPITSLLVATF